MSRGLTNAVKVLFSALDIPNVVVLVEFETLGLRLTNWPKDITFENAVYSGSGRTTDPFSLAAEGLGENLNFESPQAVLTVASVDGWFQAHSLNDELRGDVCVITILYATAAGDFLASGWTTRFACDAEEGNEDEVRVRLSSLDVVSGIESPRRTVQTQGCQWNFQESDSISGCTFRYDSTFFQGAPIHPARLQECDRTLDGPKGCIEHFPDITDPVTGDTVPRVKPFGAFAGNIDHRLVGG